MAQTLQLPMKISLLILASPSEQASKSAYRFCQAAIDQGHTIGRLFFYYQSVYIANELISNPQDETHWLDSWQSLITTHTLDAVICISAGIKRGVIDLEQRERYEKTAANLNDSFKLSGLGQLADTVIDSDRLICFGG